jgi:hypothetical protein
VVQLRLPAVNGDDGAWGDILNLFLSQEHYNTGLDDPNNGMHQTITIRPGTTVAGTAPIKFTSGPLVTTPEQGAVEYLNDAFYMTVFANSAVKRKWVMVVDEAGIATGDIFYQASNGELAMLHIGTTGQVLTVASGIPSWATPSGGGSGITRNVSSISSPTTAGAAAATDYVYYVSGTTTLTLPTAVGNTNRYSVTNTGVNTVTVATTSAQTINGSSTATLPIANMSLDFVSNGTNWVVE